MFMSAAIQLIRRGEQTTNTWSGGTTTEIAIYPNNSEYGKRNFLWRLSTATVDVEESLFTPLPGISRILMVTEGTMTLQHEGHHSVHLAPFEQDKFEGAWTTRCMGRGRDFN